MDVSVIIPTYNRGPLVREAVASVLAQDDIDLECIVIDDESSDDTYGFLSPYLKRIKYVRQANTGVGGARNKALSIATGDYITMLDDDDVWLPGKLRAQLDWLIRYPEAAFCYTDFFIWRGEQRQPQGLMTWFEHPVSWNATLGVPVDHCENGDVYLAHIYRELLKHPLVLPSTVIFRRDRVPDGLLFSTEDPNCGDWEFFARIARENPCLFLNWETALNRSHEDAYRLTRTPQVHQLRRRDDMLGRVWGLDRDFLASDEQAELFEQVLGKLLNTRFVQELAHGDIDQAWTVFERLKELGVPVSTKTRVGRVLLSIPGGIALLRRFR